MMMDPLKLRDMSRPVRMSPAMPSHMLPLCSLSPSHTKFAEGGGRLGTGRPFADVEQTALGSSMTYALTWATHR